MKRSQLYLSICLIVMCVMFSTPIYASDTQGFNFIEARKDKPAKHELNDKQKEEMKAKYDAMKAKWSSLSKAQKDEIYQIKDKSFNAEIDIINKYIEYGVIDEATGNLMKTKILEHKAKMYNDETMPNFGMKYKHKDK